MPGLRPAGERGRRGDTGRRHGATTPPEPSGRCPWALAAHAEKETGEKRAGRHLEGQHPHGRCPHAGRLRRSPAPWRAVERACAFLGSSSGGEDWGYDIVGRTSSYPWSDRVTSDVSLPRFRARRGGLPVAPERPPGPAGAAADGPAHPAGRASGSARPGGDIVDRLWGKDVFVDVETGVHTAIRKMRQALSDSPEAPTFVETVPGKGYRFIAPVEMLRRRQNPPVARGPEPTAAAVFRTSRRGWLLAAVLAVAALAGGLGSADPPGLTSDGGRVALREPERRSRARVPR